MRARPIAERFWEKVEKTDGCWLWRGRTWHRFGYGQIHEGGHQGKTRDAHRLSWELHHGSVPRGLSVLHRCDNPVCVNPAHLFLGTQADNVHDAMRKDRYGSRAGENNPHAKLSSADVESIRRLRHNGVRVVEIAAAFGVVRGTVYAISNHRSRREVAP